jgi:hypothetical protein
MDELDRRIGLRCHNAEPLETEENVEAAQP